MKTKILISSLVLASSLFAMDSHHQHHGNSKNGNSQSISAQIMNSMHEEMMKNPLVQTNDIERDYLTNMIPHHQGAIDSSKLLLQHTKSEEMKKIATNIINAQEKEIQEFKEILEKNLYKKTQLSEEEYKKFVQEEKELMQKMMLLMGAVKESKNINKDFLEGMIAHHQGAVDASKQILFYSKDETIREIAKKIILDQEKEIQEFTQLLKHM
ncbi:DUF305 domain-containing protein [Campylobacter volucris]|uniref:DUF305 domain-containing protein n=3 Tax=Campylobacter volucris TaxID=1031542 RepID=UPI0010597C63|nr:DUF305 domain-containing protein [Campylobacter volucris]MBF7041949.1 DUF305 domain-containing protein [Campylobacter volucris]MBF7045923.1 DUF305 domain-containing protein [Campylobacter volucris]MBF7047491.1 DUF305 domain-containing protein [Campylobacter volucris]MBF7067842.1 DUF305 domain-containing protein [Campylobacter volucris]MBF7068478.1 DUF305 domain-containing protein [Campylobacter volucris]